jgi:hypothetical protein
MTGDFRVPDSRHVLSAPLVHVATRDGQKAETLTPALA